MKQIDYPELPESLRQLQKNYNDLSDKVEPIVQKQQALYDHISSLTEQPEAITALTTPIVPVDPSLMETISTIKNSRIITGMGELAMRAVVPDYMFQSQVLSLAEDTASKILTNLSLGLKTLIESETARQIQAATSVIADWLKSIDFSPWLRILNDVRLFDSEKDDEEAINVFLQAMFDARWFPYAGWSADFLMIANVLEVLNTSRASKNRVKRIDKLIFSYYNKDTINDLKRGWRQKNLPSFMTRILVQAVQAYHRREYALTVSALSTLWEGIIQEKVNQSGHRISRKTRENLTKLIEENEFDQIFASFCEEFIFYKCENISEVKPDVPGRHCIAHSWYDKYPNRKMALNAILFTDFLLELEPLDQTEEADNG